MNVLASISGDGKSILLALNPKVNTSVQLVPYATLTQPSIAAGISNSSFTSASRPTAPRNSPPASLSSPAKPW